MIIFKNDNDLEFSSKFNSFVKNGGYKNYSKEDKSHLYRFLNPKNDDFPYMIELFAKNELQIDNSLLTPIKYENDYYNLSGIILDSEYFDFLQSGIKIIKNIPILNFTHIIPLKMYAYNNLIKDKEEGHNVKSSDIKKHMNDIIALIGLFIGSESIELSNKIYIEHLLFIEKLDDKYKTILNNIYFKKK